MSVVFFWVITGAAMWGCYRMGLWVERGRWLRRLDRRMRRRMILQNIAGWREWEEVDRE